MTSDAYTLAPIAANPGAVPRCVAEDDLLVVEPAEVERSANDRQKKRQYEGELHGGGASFTKQFHVRS